MSWRVTTALAALVAAMALLVYVGEEGKPPPGAEIAIGQSDPASLATPGRRVVDVAREAITGITIVKADKRVEALRHQGSWGSETTARVVDGLLDDVLSLRTLDEITVNAEELADYGLQPPQTTLEVKQDNGQSLRLSIGKRNPSATAVYVCFDGKAPVYLVGALLAWKVDSAVRDLAESDSLDSKANRRTNHQ